MDAWKIRRRSPAERLALAWDRLTPVLDGLVAEHVPADRLAEVLADLLQVGMAVDELRPGQDHL